MLISQEVTFSSGLLYTYDFRFSCCYSKVDIFTGWCTYYYRIDWYTSTRLNNPNFTSHGLKIIKLPVLVRFLPSNTHFTVYVLLCVTVRVYTSSRSWSTANSSSFLPNLPLLFRRRKQCVVDTVREATTSSQSPPPHRPFICIYITLTSHALLYPCTHIHHIYKVINSGRRVPVPASTYSTAQPQS